MQQMLDSLRLEYVWQEIITLVRYPNTNLAAALLLLSVFVFVMLLVSISVILVVIRPSSKSSRDDRDQLRYYRTILQGSSGDDADARPIPPGPAPERRFEWALWLAGSVVVLAVLWIAVGVSSSAHAVCLSCHEVNPHSEVVQAGAFDPHDDVSCVRCHEPSGLIGGVTVEVPERVVHLVRGLVTPEASLVYGHVRSSACYACHSYVRTKTTEDESRGIRMSHREPLAAGAECLYCHTLATGVVSVVTSGMAPCLRCHNGQDQPTDCDFCHTKDVSAATRSGRNIAEMTGRQLIRTPDCGGCHDQATQCDPCHGGVRMPHSEVFLSWGHARQGVEDIWDNDGDRCGRCHTPEWRPCTRCHALSPGSGHPQDFWRENHGAGGDGAPCNSCHGALAHVAGRDFCEICHGEPRVTQ